MKLIFEELDIDLALSVINSATVQNDLSWSANVAGSDLSADTSFDATVTGTDDTGNVFNEQVSHPVHKTILLVGILESLWPFSEVLYLSIAPA
mgnify:CR=1 FL=1